MTPEEEKKLAEALADRHDRRVRGQGGETLQECLDDMDTAADIDRVLDEVPPIPEFLSGHRVLKEIGQGGMGRVLLARDEALGRDVAIKMLAPQFAQDPILRTRFMSEARAMAKLKHPNVARIYTLGAAGEPPHFVMEYVEGQPLTKAAATLPLHDKVDLMLRVALTVHCIHEHGTVHRDLKPANILVDSDGQPKVLDFGLALELDHPERLSMIGEIAGTPQYLSPEQAAGARKLDARSDIFALGAILYELLTGAPPFVGDAISELLKKIREDDPVLPRRLRRDIPRDLQNICLKALEKNPANRYRTARDFADDLQRFRAGEPVVGIPAAYSRLISARVDQHLGDLEDWRDQQIISDAEYDGLRARYRRLKEREDAWILEARRLTLPQVSLYLGAWMLAVGAAFLTLFPFPSLAGWPAVVVSWGAAVPTVLIGLLEWRRENFRVAIAYLLAFCLLVPVAVLVTLEEARVLASFTRGNANLELFSRWGFARQATNAQIWWSLLAGLPVCLALRRHTRAPVFSLVSSTFAAMLSMATLLLLGLFEWVDHDPGRLYLNLVPVAVGFLAAGFALEKRRLADDSRYLYPMGLLFTMVALSGVAAVHEPLSDWLKRVWAATRGQHEYLFIANAGAYYLLYRAAASLDMPQTRLLGKAFRFVIPGHVMTSLLLLGLNAPRHGNEARIFEWGLPMVACLFVFISIPQQMKNFFASGMVFFAIGVYRLQGEVFKGRPALQLALVAGGLMLMLAAARYAALRGAVGRIPGFLRRK